MHLGVGTGLLRAARRSRQIGGTGAPDLQRQPDRLASPAGAAGRGAGVRRLRRARGHRTIAIHASYLINLAGSAEPFASQSREGLIVEMQRAPAYGATIVNTHIGSHRGVGRDAGLRRIVENVRAVLASRRRRSARARELVRRRRHARLPHRGAGGDPGGRRPGRSDRLAFCLDTAHLWGAGYDISTRRGRRR